MTGHYPAVIDLVVPTINGREESLERCVESYRKNSSVKLNVIVVPESKTCGWGWKQGLAAMRAPYVLLACDDQESISVRWAEVCIKTVRMGKLPCPRVWNSDGSLQSAGGNMASLHHVDRRPQRDWTVLGPQGYSVQPFMSAAQAERI